MKQFMFVLLSIGLLLFIISPLALEEACIVTDKETIGSLLILTMVSAVVLAIILGTKIEVHYDKPREPYDY